MYVCSGKSHCKVIMTLWRRAPSAGYYRNGCMGVLVSAGKGKKERLWACRRWWCEKGGKNKNLHVSGWCGRKLPENHIGPALRSVLHQKLQRPLKRSLAIDSSPISTLAGVHRGIVIPQWTAAVATCMTSSFHKRLQHHQIIVSPWTAKIHGAFHTFPSFFLLRCLIFKLLPCNTGELLLYSSQ